MRLLGRLGLVTAGFFAGFMAAAALLKRALPSRGDATSDEVALVAVFDGTVLRSEAKAFRGGSMLAWYGGIQADLREAELAPRPPGGHWRCSGESLFACLRNGGWKTTFVCLPAASTSRGPTRTILPLRCSLSTVSPRSAVLASAESLRRTRNGVASSGTSSATSSPTAHSRGTSSPSSRTREIPEDLLQPLAREMAFSETVFVYRPEREGHVRLRIFTPVVEVRFAGHPVLGSAFVLARAAPGGGDRLETDVGVIPVRLEREGARIVFGRMEQPLPTIQPIRVS